MHNCIATAENRRQLCRVGDVSDHKLTSLGQLAMTGREIVVDNHFVTFALQHSVQYDCQCIRRPQLLERPKCPPSQHWVMIIEGMQVVSDTNKLPSRRERKGSGRGSENENL